MSNVTTTNLADFGQRELYLLKELIGAMPGQGLPDGFTNENVIPMFNKNSGEVFLTNADYQVAMLNGKDLEIFHSCFYCGHESFAEDFDHESQDEECTEAMLSVKSLSENK